ncbi:LacI family DNA-binding transcriptional regulator [Phaeovulum sp. W22_SRMD_FR3]|uniref:LacI family DNA-binding transcriptional regulator n=1 Tax=Phaeovulum sp. W22_SRMD_FR3 TaxID=3240274 RepID=UPI003F9C7B6C
MEDTQKMAKGTIRMADVARVAQVSPMTVSNSFRNPHLVNPETRRKVLETATMLGYVPNAMAGNLASGQSKVVALLTPSIRYSSFADMIETLGNRLAAEGYHVIMTLLEGAAREVETLRAMIGRRVDGIIIAGELQDPAARDLIRQQATPLVETWHLHPGLVDLAVGFSEHDASRDAVRHLLASGRRRIGMIGLEPAGHRRLSERIKGYRTAMAEVGDAGERLVLLPADSNGYQAGSEGLRRLLTHWPDMDGIFCMTDILAVGALFECHRTGRAVPGQLAVMGYGNYDIAAEVPPGLSTVQTPGSAIGDAAAGLLLDRLQGRATAARHQQVPYQLICRHSV